MGLVTFSMWEMWARVAVIWRNMSAVSLDPATATILLTRCNVKQGTRRLFSQDLCLCSSLVASSRCSSFNSFTVAVSHLTLSKSVIVSLPRHNIPVTVSKNKIFFKQHGIIF